MQPCAVYRRLASAVKSHIGCKGLGGRRHSMQMVTKREQGWLHLYKIDFKSNTAMKDNEGYYLYI